jgi:branched-chain amino acid transport system substrate-binding protein
MRTFKQHISIVLLFILAVFTLFNLSCENSAKQNDVIKIGIMEPLSNDNAAYGEPVKTGAVFAFDQINLKGGINGKKIEYIVEDVTSEQSAISAYRKLVDVDKVSAVVGPGISAYVLAIAPVVNEKKVPVMGTTCENSKITNSGDYVFRVYQSYSPDGIKLAEFTFNDWGAKTAAVIHVDNDFGNDLAKIFEDRFQQLGGKIVANEAHKEAETDFRTTLTKIKATNPDVIFVNSYIKEMPEILVQARQLGLNSKFVASSSFYDEKVLKMAGKAAEGVVAATSFYDIKGSDPLVINYVQEFKSKTNQDADYWSGFGYDAANILALAISRGGNSPEAIKNEIYKISNYQGVTGNPVSFDQNGDVVKPIRLVIVKDGKFETVGNAKAAGQ